MADSGHAGILRRKMRPAPARRPRDGAGDVWRRMLPRAAADELGLELVVSGFQERPMDLHAELAVEEGALLLLLSGEAGGVGGLAVIDPSLMNGLIEVQTTGRVSSGRREPRRPTAVDAALCGYVVEAWLAVVAEARGEAWWPAVRGPAADVRTALLKLEEGAWIETRVDLDLSGGKRAGRICIYRRESVAAVVEGDAPDGLRAKLLPVETSLEAVLCRVRVPLGTVAALEPGQLVPLPGVNLRRIRLEAPMGRLVAEVHLGQSGGYRAVRVLADDAEAEPPPRLDGTMRIGASVPEAGAFATEAGAPEGLPDLGIALPPLPGL